MAEVGWECEMDDDLIVEGDNMQPDVVDCHISRIQIQVHVYIDMAWLNNRLHVMFNLVISWEIYRRPVLTY